MMWLREYISWKLSMPTPTCLVPKPIVLLIIDGFMVMSKDRSHLSKCFIPHLEPFYIIGNVSRDIVYK